MQLINWISENTLASFMFLALLVFASLLLAPLLRKRARRNKLLKLLIVYSLFSSLFGSGYSAYMSDNMQDQAAAPKQNFASLANSKGGKPASPATSNNSNPDANANAKVSTILTSTETVTATVPIDTDTPNPLATGTSVATGTGIYTTTDTSTSTSVSTGTSTTTPSSTPTQILPPPTSTVSLPTPAPTLPPIAITNTDLVIDNARNALLAQVSALPELTGTITGTLVSGQTGGRINSDDGGLTLGMLPGIVPVTDTINVQVDPVTFQQGDPSSTRNGQPLAYAYSLTATESEGGQRVTQFNSDVTLVWNINWTTLATAGIHGFPLHVYTLNEQNGAWEEILSRWDPQTNQLVATTPHFSEYAVGDGFDTLNNYLANINGFESDLQSGASTVDYALDVPKGPGGFGPSVSLRYNSASIDRVDISQQGTSPIGWGWSLSTSYIAATEHFFLIPQHTGTPVPYNPWTPSLVMNGVNKDLTQGADSNWHTASEEYTKIQYSATNDQWDAWGKDGTHYVFKMGSRIADHSPSGNPHVTNKWMLTTATDVHGNVIHYTYKYQDLSISPTHTPAATPMAGDLKTGAVYPYQISYGDTGDGSGDKVQVTFDIVPRPSATADDASTNDINSEIFQLWKIDKIDVSRKQASTDWALLRSYHLGQDFSIVLQNNAPTPTPYPHLALTGITLYAKDASNNDHYLPSTTFTYISSTYNCTANSYTQSDWGHLCAASNGYGGEVDYSYVAAGPVNQAYRRVSTKEVKDGLSGGGSHDVTYQYDYRGAALNATPVSAEAGNSKPLHNPGREFRGYAWVQQRDPMNQATDNYFSQVDEYKSKGYRVQAGKAITFTDNMNVSPTPTTNSDWTFTGDITGVGDPAGGTNRVWKVPVATPFASSITRKNGVGDGADVAMRFYVKKLRRLPQIS
jgi:hypothetical protein